MLRLHVGWCSSWQDMRLLGPRDSIQAALRMMLRRSRVRSEANAGQATRQLDTRLTLADAVRDNHIPICLWMASAISRLQSSRASGLKPSTSRRASSRVAAWRAMMQSQSKCSAVQRSVIAQQQAYPAHDLAHFAPNFHAHPSPARFLPRMAYRNEGQSASSCRCVGLASFRLARRVRAANR